ncbi:MAG: iron-containing redox enzyme family protein [Thauera sp.]|nr:iron-containing redox enzyme family protein [Thauera sp.]
MMIRELCRAGDFLLDRPQDAAGDVRGLYSALLDERRRDEALPAARRYLLERLREAEDIADDLPASLCSEDWLGQRIEEVGAAYRSYLDERAAGGSRRFFSNRAHALYFLRGVAPTKLVDGAWLYGLLRRWRDPDFLPLIRTYLEELGDGSPELNHVVLYRNLLASLGCEDWERGRAPADYVQGTIQLGLAWQADEFLPEVIGFNLGYEQLPLHLLITAYELDELGIDPYYFTLHVTVDNAANGHARKALKSVADIAPTGAGREEFLRRVRLGYRLNMLGSSTESVIRGFDLDAELIRLLSDKSVAGRYMHSDHCRIGGRSVSQWLGERGNIPAFLDAMQQHGWIKRGRPPSESRFWQLIRGERAEMFGVFSAYEVQVLEDWIAGGAAEASTRSFRQMERLRRARAKTGEQPAETPDDEPRLEERLAECVDRGSLLDALPRMMSPSRHHTVAGLFATRMFSEMLGVARP